MKEKKTSRGLKTRALIANTGPFLVPVPLAEIKYADFPEIRINKHESTEMPFRYMVDDDLMPIMPQVRYPPVIVLLRITGDWGSDSIYLYQDTEC